MSLTPQQLAKMAERLEAEQEAAELEEAQGSSEPIEIEAFNGFASSGAIPRIVYFDDDSQQ